MLDNCTYFHIFALRFCFRCSSAVTHQSIPGEETPPLSDASAQSARLDFHKVFLHQTRVAWCVLKSLLLVLLQSFPTAQWTTSWNTGVAHTTTGTDVEVKESWDVHMDSWHLCSQGLMLLTLLDFYNPLRGKYSFDHHFHPWYLFNEWIQQILQHPWNKQWDPWPMNQRFLKDSICASYGIRPCTGERQRLDAKGTPQIIPLQLLPFTFSLFPISDGQKNLEAMANLIRWKKALQVSHKSPAM